MKFYIISVLFLQLEEAATVKPKIVKRIGEVFFVEIPSSGKIFIGLRLLTKFVEVD